MIALVRDECTQRAQCCKKVSVSLETQSYVSCVFLDV